MNRAGIFRRRPAAGTVEPTRRLILVGASNLTRGLATATAVARRNWGEPFDLLAAPGNGRSYGWATNILGRQLGSIIDCGLWRSWARLSDLPTSAVVTDVGNDVMYGATVDEILSWVKTVFVRLQNRGVRTVVTGLPLERIRLLKPRQYTFVRGLLFPGNTLDFSAALARSEAVDAGLRKLAADQGATFVEPRLEWYGWDPIHLRRATWGAAWSAILAGLEPTTTVEPAGVAPWSWLASQFWRPEERRLFGFEQRRAQPSVYFADGSRLSIF
jgi:hypothetical protein